MGLIQKHIQSLYKDCKLPLLKYNGLIKPIQAINSIHLAILICENEVATTQSKHLSRRDMLKHIFFEIVPVVMR